MPVLPRSRRAEASPWAQAEAGAARVDPERLANPTHPDSRIIKTRRGWVRGYAAQVVVTPQQIILASELPTKANDVQQLHPRLGRAQALIDLLLGEDARLAATAADAGSWSEENVASRTEECELFIATHQDLMQLAELREAASPRRRMPRGAFGASAHAAHAEDQAGPDHLRQVQRVGGAGHWLDE